MQEEQIKTKIQELITDFRANYSKYEHGSEADTETKLVEPLFYALGWTKADFDKRPKAGREGKRGIADYSFKINDNIVFYLEVKKVGISLEKEADRQVVSYALYKRPAIPFAVSTNFEELKVFCVEQENSRRETFTSFRKPEAYLSDFQNLLWLSKERFENGATLQKAMDDGRLKKRVAIDKVLLEDLMQMRKLLVEDIEKNYDGTYDLNEKDAIVQRIIDRLIFIRRCEDVGINPKNITLMELTELPHIETYPKLKNYFKDYNDVYNSGLFAVGIDNDCDKIKIDGEIVKKLISCLYYSKDDQYIYNFGQEGIDADVLGQVYEQYLGKILHQTKSGKAKLKEGQAHKKEQGIYYTPTYIVDFIIKNTLGEALQNKKITVADLKVLDPACGSGSFLIKAFDYLYANLSTKNGVEQHKLDGQGSYSIKTDVLKKNLYGVDLDDKAVEITKLNLLLKAAEKFRKLPEEVDLHIKHGNSLVDDENIDKNAFKWGKNFERGSFDVVIGNPPWVSIKGKHKSTDLSDKELQYLLTKYKTDTYMPNLYEFFIKEALLLTKEGGYFSFVVPDRLCTNQQFKLLRKELLEKYSIKKLWLKVPFPEVIADTVVFVIQKIKSNDSFIEVAEYPENKFIKTPKKIFVENQDNSFFYIKKDIFNLFDKIKSRKETILLSNLVKSTSGCGAKSEKITKEKINQKQIKILKGESIGQYQLRDNFWFDFIPDNLSGRTRDEIKLGKKLKVLIRKTGADLISTFDDTGIYPEQSLYFIYTDSDNEREKLLVILGLINSKLINCYYRNFAITNRDSTPQLKNIDLDRFPIIIPKDLSSFTNKIEKMLLLNKKLLDLGEKNTTETKDLKDKIESLNKELNQEVYNLYNLNEKEIELVEKS